MGTTIGSKVPHGKSDFYVNFVDHLLYIVNKGDKVKTIHLIAEFIGTDKYDKLVFKSVAMVNLHYGAILHHIATENLDDELSEWYEIREKWKII